MSLTFAFAIVAVSTFISIPILLYGLGLGADGWTWVHVALFSSMVASTDAVAGESLTLPGKSRMKHGDMEMDYRL